ncbi:unnamed protein product [Lactuca saligna]|uniref:Exocyst complex subunit Exo70 C-terminal domain-containing protein n=1 Tax=Lactuca saligna TaxID=75948 RepID=A0AA35YB56_LACSI|nr:unnamed protein product [Lactuca saligna]
MRVSYNKITGTDIDINSRAFLRLKTLTHSALSTIDPETSPRFRQPLAHFSSSMDPRGCGKIAVLDLVLEDLLKEYPEMISEADICTMADRKEHLLPPKPTSAINLYVVELQRRLKATGVGVVWQSEGAKLNRRMGNSNRSLGLKIFNGQFEELHQRQSQWTVPETELRESIILAVVEVLLPVYESFIKCFGYRALVENGKNPIKYIRSSHKGGCYCKYNGTTLSIRIFNSVSSKAMDDPFVVLETASTPTTLPPSVFIDPLETVHKMNKSESTNTGPATLSIPHLVTSLKIGLEATQEAALDTLFLLRLAWSACPIDVSKSS